MWKDSDHMYKENHIENDYIFQLNPFKFFEIPEIYLNELKDFLSSQAELV